MANESDKPEESARMDWLLEPPDAGNIRFQFSVGKNVKLSQEARSALDDLMKALNIPGAESTSLKQGIGDGCTEKSCKKDGSCQPYSVHVCLKDVICYIKD